MTPMQDGEALRARAVDQAILAERADAASKRPVELDRERHQLSDRIAIRTAAEQPARGFRRAGSSGQLRRGRFRALPAGTLHWHAEPGGRLPREFAALRIPPSS